MFQVMGTHAERDRLPIHVNTVVVHQTSNAFLVLIAECEWDKVRWDTEVPIEALIVCKDEPTFV